MTRLQIVEYLSMSTYELRTIVQYSHQHFDYYTVFCSQKIDDYSSIFEQKLMASVQNY